MEVLTLLPLAGAEVSGGQNTFLRCVFEGEVQPPPRPLNGDAFMDEVLCGGYPEMRTCTPARRVVWARDYLQAILARDVRDAAEVSCLDLMPRLRRLVAAQAGQLCNYAALGAQLQLDEKTARLSVDRTPYGALLETWVLAKLAKLISWHDEPVRLGFLRTKEQLEVDAVLKRADGALVGVEVKAAATVTAADFRGLRQLDQASPGQMKIGLVLYDGDQALPSGDRLWAVQVGCLWG